MQNVFAVKFAVGLAFTSTLVVDVEVQPAAFVRVTVYKPLIATVEDAMVGFCVLLAEYANGPTQSSVAEPPTEFNCIVAPAQYAPPLVAFAIGFAFTVTVVVEVEVHPAALVTVTVYTPLIATVDVGRVGFCVLVAVYAPDQPNHQLLTLQLNLIV